MCPDCRRLHDAWLDYRLPARVPFATQQGYDLTTAGVVERRSARAEDHYRLVRQQLAALKSLHPSSLVPLDSEKGPTEAGPFSCTLPPLRGWKRAA